MVRTSATEVIGMQKPQRTSGWRDQEYNEAVCVKDRLYQRSIQIKTRATKEHTDPKGGKLSRWRS
uniref:Uncharacterized protein n=1 Tax=Megaselia scalaris TaxID=36166 RepID=T1GTH4_MEGSC